MERKIVITAALFGAVAIILGAFGAHALKKVLSADELVSFETGVRYQMYHALFLFFVATTSLVGEKTKETILYLTLVGVIFFSGSIYLLATRSLSGINFKFLGPVTPVGGLLLISAWIVLLLNVFNKRV